MKNAKAKKKKSVLKLPELTCDELRKILRIRCKLVLNDFAEKKYDFRYTREKSEKLAHQERGGRKYLPPEGWAKLALAVKDKYASNKWLQKESGWPAVHRARHRARGLQDLPGPECAVTDCTPSAPRITMSTLPK